jgi:hypothetical protein
MFQPFPKIARLSRDIVITEKIDGTNAQVVVSTEQEYMQPFGSFPIITEVGDLIIGAGSRKRYLVVGDDNFGFARWVRDNAAELSNLGPGHHFGEWWGSGIQRGYGLPKGEKRFSLFNVHRWGEDRPACCHVVPVLYTGEFSTPHIDDTLQLLAYRGSQAAPGFMDPEGIIIYHTHASVMFKKTLKDDEKGKGSG